MRNLFSNFRENIEEQRRLLTEELVLNAEQTAVFTRFNTIWTMVVFALDECLAHPENLDLCLSFFRQLFRAGDIARELSELSTLDDKEDFDSPDVDALDIAFDGFWNDVQNFIEPDSGQFDQMLSEDKMHLVESRLRDIARGLMERN